MRKVINLNSKWAFSKLATELPTEINNKWDFVNLPHCWNAIDGQDGDNDYFRGTAYYAKTIKKAELPEAEQYYLEIQGANSSADVYLNGQKLAHHDGGYSTWRVNLTDSLEAVNLLVIAVDNSANETVYPQMADFTFYGGIYRDVNIIAVDDSHFDLDYHGGPGLAVTPEVEGKNAKVKVEAYVTNLKAGQT
ncbi:MAG: glycoside hydrolase family 2 protein, partial [Clostridia bacterium]|nr:glycoside hydrolase family 2 protein [Clostridia bacterium]